MLTSLSAICLDTVGKEQEIRGLQCRHAFHQHCIDDWFLQNHVNCPLCRMPFFKNKHTQELHAAVWV